MYLAVAEVRVAQVRVPDLLEVPDSPVAGSGCPCGTGSARGGVLSSPKFGGSGGGGNGAIGAVPPASLGDLQGSIRAGCIPTDVFLAVCFVLAICLMQTNAAFL